MIPLILLKLAMRFGVPDRFRKLAAGAIGVVAILIVIGLGYCAFEYWFAKHDYAVIQNDRAISNADIRNTQIETERQAGADKSMRDDQFANNQTELKDDTNAAAHNSTSPIDELFKRLH
jgi:hypothetical protein